MRGCDCDGFEGLSHALEDALWRGFVSTHRDHA